MKKISKKINFYKKLNKNILLFILLTKTMLSINLRNFHGEKQVNKNDYMSKYVKCYFNPDIPKSTCNNDYFDRIKEINCRGDDYDCAYQQCILQNTASDIAECSSLYYSVLKQAHCEEYDFECKEKLCSLSPTMSEKNSCLQILKNTKKQKLSNPAFCFGYSCINFYQTVRGSNICKYIIEKTDLFKKCKKKSYKCVEKILKKFSNIPDYISMLKSTKKTCQPKLKSNFLDLKLERK